MTSNSTSTAREISKDRIRDRAISEAILLLAGLARRCPVRIIRAGLNF